MSFTFHAMLTHCRLPDVDHLPSVLRSSEDNHGIHYFIPLYSIHILLRTATAVAAKESAQGVTFPQLA